LTTRHKQSVTQILLEVGAAQEVLCFAVRTSDRTAGGREQRIAGIEIPARFDPQAVDDDQNHYQMISNDDIHDFQSSHGLLDADIDTMEGSIQLYLILFAGQQILMNFLISFF
jgi:hypothetical protein